MTAESDDDDSDAWVDGCKYCSLEFLTEDEFIYHLRENHVQIMHSGYPQYYPSEGERYLEPGTSLVPLEKSRAFFNLDNHQKPHNVYPQNHPIVYPRRTLTSCILGTLILCILRTLTSCILRTRTVGTSSLPRKVKTTSWVSHMPVEAGLVNGVCSYF